ALVRDRLEQPEPLRRVQRGRDRQVTFQEVLGALHRGVLRFGETVRPPAFDARPYPLLPYVRPLRVAREKPGHPLAAIAHAGGEADHLDRIDGDVRAFLVRRVDLKIRATMKHQFAIRRAPVIETPGQLLAREVLNLADALEREIETRLAPLPQLRR